MRPLDLGIFGGWSLPERFGFLERLALKAIQAPVGDFRDWGAIEAWAGGLPARLGVGG